MDIRSAGLVDLEALCDIASIVDPPHDGAEFDVSYYEHVLQHGHVVVAEANEIIVGYAAVIDVDGAHHLSDLFLHPDTRGRDIGRHLLDAVWNVDGASSPRQTFSSLHPAALPLYVRAGMTPRWPLLYLVGDPTRLPYSPLSVSVLSSDSAATLEAQWLGWDRVTEYRYWSRRPEARVFAINDDSSPVAVGCSIGSGGVHSIGRLACVDASVVSAALSAAARELGSDVMVSVPGTNPALPMLLAAGWRILEHDLYCSSQPELIDPLRLLPHPGLL